MDGESLLIFTITFALYIRNNSPCSKVILFSYKNYYQIIHHSIGITFTHPIKKIAVAPSSNIIKPRFSTSLANRARAPNQRSKRNQAKIPDLLSSTERERERESVPASKSPSKGGPGTRKKPGSSKKASRLI